MFSEKEKKPCEFLMDLEHFYGVMHKNDCGTTWGFFYGYVLIETYQGTTFYFSDCFSISCLYFM